jgi:single-stranded-DNA-specific exonuclease
MPDFTEKSLTLYNYILSLEKKWNIKEQGDPIIARRLAADLGIDHTLANLLVQRNVHSFEEAKYFFRPSLENLHDPFLMTDMQKAVDRIGKAIERHEKIMIYGDYDVDGTTAVALVYSFLKQFTSHISYYIPDRDEEGYGISYQGIDYAKKQDISLIIALDCGIKANDKIDYANDRSIDFIICDHHLPGEVLPNAVAVLDPKRSDCHYPFDDLSGCGVGFKLMQGYCQHHLLPLEQLYTLLDLVAVSISADLVSIIGENRILTHYGLKRLNESPQRGLQSIIKLAGLDKHHITVDDVVFRIAPRINAAGRMESGKAAVDLLIAKNDELAIKIGNTINSHNDDRKHVDREITKEALNMIAKDEMLRTRKSIVVYNPNWHKGVVGIVASRIVESYFRPSIVLTESNGFITGSARSIPGFDLYLAIESCSHLLETFGGHMYAAGLTLREENFEEFCKLFEDYVSKNITDQMLIPQIDVDTILEFKQITPKFFRLLKQFQPFGPGNLSPVFLTENVYDNGNGRLVGSDDGHLKLELIQEEEPYRHISAIAFSQPEHFAHMQAGNPIDVCYSVSENYYRGIANIQLRIKDIKPRDVIV